MRGQFISLWLLATIPAVGGCASQPDETSQPAKSRTAVQNHHPATAIATQMLGKPYRYGGSTPRGFDCSGLVYYAYHKAGFRVPRTSQQQYQDSLPVKRDHIQEGDLLFFRIDGKVSHVGVYLGNNRFIHAPSSGKQVIISSLNTPYWKERLVKTGRFF